MMRCPLSVRPSLSFLWVASRAQCSGAQPLFSVSVSVSLSLSLLSLLSLSLCFSLLVAFLVLLYYFFVFVINRLWFLSHLTLSGPVLRYSLPHIALEQKYILKCRPFRMALNCTSQRIAVIDINGIVSFFDMEARAEGAGPMVRIIIVADVSVSVWSHGVSLLAVVVVGLWIFAVVCLCR